MTARRRLALPTLVLGAGCAALCVASAAPAAARASARAQSSQPAPRKLERTLLHSHELWATIDVCSPPNQRDTVGVRGSMPGDGDAHDEMYMSFRLQYETAGKRWVDISSGTSAGWVSVGAAGSARQSGSSFALKPAAGKPAATLRGVVDFQWRRGGRVLVSAAEPTSAAHKSLAGADPPGYSAATCVIG
ncbi:MAG TPA: hypothetical protein VKV16_00985 [Solirubrobacteraceae bacterium]|nr:hypothetical protein [Solirubrobacteraceae bacterium]